MATAQDYLSAIKAIYPNVKVDDGLTAELNRRAAENADPNSVVHDAASYYQVSQGNQDAASQQASAQVDPGLAATKADLQNEQDVANNSAKALQDSIAKVYQNKALNDPLARQGIVSGAQQSYDANQQADQLKSVGTDLSSKLSYIAKQLTNADTGAAQQKSALTQQYLQGYGKDSQNTLQQAIASQQAQQKAEADARQQDFQNQLALANLQNSTYSAHKASAADNSGLDLSSIIGAITGGGSVTSAPSLSTEQVSALKGYGIDTSSGGVSDAISTLQNAFKSGNLSNDAQAIAAIQKDTGMSPQQAASLFYNIRKPYEQ